MYSTEYTSMKEENEAYIAPDADAKEEAMQLKVIENALFLFF